MSCVYDCIKWLLFIFNLLFALLGIAILAVSVWILVGLNSLDDLTDSLNTPTIIFIVIGIIIFVIAFFGCCGAIRESHCMVVTFAVFLLTILIIQVGIGIWSFVLTKNFSTDETISSITADYRENIFNNYWTNQSNRDVVDFLQDTFECCGVDGPSDFSSGTTNFNSTIPWSCCGNTEPEVCNGNGNVYQIGCIVGLTDFLQLGAKVIGIIAVCVAATELIGIIFALCLANSIRNDDRRGYRV